jgi:hypothetical protein
MLSESVALCVYPKENSRLTDGQATLEIERVAVMERRITRMHTQGGSNALVDGDAGRKFSGQVTLM